MLLSFSVENYFSFKERQTLYLLPTEELTHNIDLLKKAPEIKALPTALIYGSNGFGKSLFINSIHNCIKNIDADYIDNNCDSKFAFRFIGENQKEYYYEESYEALDCKNKAEIIRKLYIKNQDSNEGSLIKYDKNILKSFTDDFVFFKETHQIMIPHLFRNLEESRKELIQDILYESGMRNINDETVDYQSKGILQFIDILNAILDALEKSKILICDDFAANLDTRLKELLINLFQTSFTNFRKAQLIITTNDSSLMRNCSIYIDQISIISKYHSRDSCTSTINRASDYKEVNNSNVYSYYNSGRLGGKAYNAEWYIQRKTRDFIKYKLCR